MTYKLSNFNESINHNTKYNIKNNHVNDKVKKHY